MIIFYGALIVFMFTLWCITDNLIRKIAEQMAKDEEIDE